MTSFVVKKWNLKQQFLATVIIISVVSLLCYLISSYTGYRVVPFILLVTVSIIAMLFDIGPVLLSALLSALIWNFFFLEPRYTFHIKSAEDALMFLMYFIVAMINAVLTHKIRQVEQYARDKEEKAKLVKLYNTLINSLSHELRTPITTILGATDTLVNEKSKLSTEDYGKLLDEIADATLRLNQQVENLLNMSRLETGFIKLKKDWVDMNELVYDVINHLGQNHDTHHIIVDIEEDLPFFKLDFVLIEQCLKNLINNAISYTPGGTTIRITVRSTESSCLVVVEDSGPGFPQHEIEKVFDKFYRLENARTGGTGLGLSIVKGFVESHGGTVELENRETFGARFTLNIPTEKSYVKNLKNE